jgi:hypothetical protein
MYFPSRECIFRPANVFSVPRMYFPSRECIFRPANVSGVYDAVRSHSGDVFSRCTVMPAHKQWRSAGRAQPVDVVDTTVLQHVLAMGG